MSAARERQLLRAVRSAAHLVAVGLDADPDIDEALRDELLRSTPREAPPFPITWLRAALTGEDAWRIACSGQRLASAEEAASAGPLTGLRRACLLAERAPPSAEPFADLLVLPDADLEVVVAALGAGAARRVARALGDAGPAWLRVALASLGAELGGDAEDLVTPRLMALVAMLPEVAPFAGDVSPERLAALVAKADLDDAAVRSAPAGVNHRR